MKRGAVRRRGNRSMLRARWRKMRSWEAQLQRGKWPRALGQLKGDKGERGEDRSRKQNKVASALWTLEITATGQLSFLH